MSHYTMIYKISYPTRAHGIIVNYNPKNIFAHLARDFEWYSLIFKTVHAKNFWRIINTIGSIWRETVLGYLSLPQSWEFSLSYAFGKLFTSRTGWHPRCVTYMTCWAITSTKGFWWIIVTLMAWSFSTLPIYHFEKFLLNSCTNMMPEYHLIL